VHSHNISNALSCQTVIKFDQDSN